MREIVSFCMNMVVCIIVYDKGKKSHVSTQVTIETIR